MSPYAVTLSQPELRYLSYKNNTETLKEKIASKVVNTEKNTSKQKGPDIDEIKEFTNLYSGKDISSEEDIEEYTDFNHEKEIQDEDTDIDISSN